MIIDDSEIEKALLDSALMSLATLPDNYSGFCTSSNLILGNTLDSVNSRMVLNLFIDGEEPEYVDDTPDDAPAQPIKPKIKTARQILAEIRKQGTFDPQVNKRVMALMDALLLQGWTVYQPYDESITMQSPTEHTRVSVYSNSKSGNELFVEHNGDIGDYTGGNYDTDRAITSLATELTEKSSEEYLEKGLGIYVEDGIVGGYDDDPSDDPIEELYAGKQIPFAISGILLEQAVKDEGGIILWGDYEASLHNQTLFDNATTHYGVTAQIGKDNRVYGRAGISESGLITLYRGANGDSVFGTAQYKPEITHQVKALFATKKP